ncbi:MAG: F420-dependent NADP oxidoreductase [Chloroflexi bacterium]|nr:MAG: F420-dependent NADP oxidoreductase [Chloroflexota bacterium]
MKIAVIGTGNVGRALGPRWAANGHQVTYGSRDPHSQKVRDLVAASGANASATTSPEAAADAEVVVLATPWEATEAIVRSFGDLTGKLVVDATNPLTHEELGLSVGHTSSAGEQVAAWAKGARVVKAFNMTGARNMTNPDYHGQPITMFICGDDAEAKRVVAGLTTELGFESVDAGSLSVARELEPLAVLWIRLAYMLGLGTNIAFKLLRR